MLVQPSGLIGNIIRPARFSKPRRSFLSAASSEKGFGITGMKERTELSGGSFKIESVPKTCTTVRAYWKYH
jgi:signal transduction histidine kinase